MKHPSSCSLAALLALAGTALAPAAAQTPTQLPPIDAQPDDAEIDGVCRSINLVRPTAVPIKLEIEVVRRADRLGCPPAALTSIAEALVAAMQGDRRPINGEDVTTFMIRSAIEAAFPNVEVTSVEGARGAGSVGAMPITVGFYEIASFDLEDITVTNAT